MNLTDALDEATVEQLFDELAKRFTSVIFAGVRPLPRDDDQEQFHISFSGGLTAAIGLAVRTRRDLLKATDDAEDGDEEGN